MCRYFNTYSDRIVLFKFYLAACALMLLNDVMLTGVDLWLAGWVWAELFITGILRNPAEYHVKNISLNSITLNRLIWPMWSLCTSHEWRLSAFHPVHLPLCCRRGSDGWNDTAWRRSLLSLTKSAMQRWQLCRALCCHSARHSADVAVLHLKPSNSSTGH